VPGSRRLQTPEKDGDTAASTTEGFCMNSHKNKHYSNDPVQAIMKFIWWLLHLCKLLREFQFTLLFTLYLSSTKEASRIVICTNLISPLIQNVHWFQTAGKLSNWSLVARFNYLNFLWWRGSQSLSPFFKDQRAHLNCQIINTCL